MNKRSYEASLLLIDEMMDIPSGHRLGPVFDALVDAVIEYENKLWPADFHLGMVERVEKGAVTVEKPYKKVNEIKGL